MFLDDYKMNLSSKKYRQLDFISIPFKCNAVGALFYVISSIFHSLLGIVQVSIMAKFINNICLFVTNNVCKNVIFQSAFYMIGIIILQRMCEALSALSIPILRKGISLKYTLALTNKCALLRYESIEDEDTWNLIQRIKETPDEKIIDGFENLVSFLMLLIQSLGVIIVISLHAKYVGLATFFMFIPIVITSIKGGKATYSANASVSAYKRISDYYHFLLTDRSTVAERNIFSFLDFVQSEWRKCFFKTKKAQKYVVKKSLFLMKTVSCSMSVLMVLMELILVFSLKKGLLSAGLFISLAQYEVNLVNLMSWSLADNMKGVSFYISYIKDMHNFFDLEESKGALCKKSLKKTEVNTIRFHNVSFTYHDNKKVINNINFTINKGEHVAIVGSNGAGKTTLIKLLLKLYENYEGSIFINDKSLEEWNLEDIKAMFSVLFQDFSKYEISLRENLILGDLEIMDGINDENLKEILHKTGEEDFVESELGKLNMHLGKIFIDGVDLSGGEWQRVAMARGLLAKSPVLILDEPTAALDPVNESKIYEKFQEISQGTTTIFITHRLASTRFADKILVLDKGQIVQFGSHDELLSRKGLYQEMYKKQKGWYES